MTPARLGDPLLAHDSARKRLLALFTSAQTKARRRSPIEDLDERSGVALPSDVCKLASLFAARTADATDAQAIGVAMAAALFALEQALRAVIGAQGAAALYMRSVYLAARQHIWLLDVWRDGDRQVDLPRLREAMAQQNVDAAAAAAQALLQRFDRLLSNLIGESLMERLLLPVYEEPWHEAPNEGRAT